jgi:spermidine synthase
MPVFPGAQRTHFPRKTPRPLRIAGNRWRHSVRPIEVWFRPAGSATIEASVTEFEGMTPVKKWTTLDQALTPGGKTISLEEHDGSYTIRVDGAALMSTRQHGSEEKLAELACAHIRGIRRARVLIGGLGFGFTLKAALSMLAPDATVVVAEILAAVIAWNRNPAIQLAAAAVADRRVIVLQQDVLDTIRQERHGFDAIILDVDNGPAALSSDGNARLYGRAGLQLARAALRPGGCLAIWSAAPDPPFERVMTGAGFIVDVQGCRSRVNSGRRHTLFLGRIE